MKNHLSISFATILALSVPGMVKAQLYVTAAIGGVPSVSGATLENFEEPNPSILTLSGNAYLVTGYPDFGYTPPYFSGSTAAYFGESPTTGYDASQYVAVETGGSATLSFSTPQNYLGLLWGSVDPNNNYLTFYDSANNLIGTLWGSVVTGIQYSSADPDGTAYVNIMSTTPFSSVVVNTTGDQGYWSFEFDDVAYAYVVPEPANCVFLGFGIYILAFVLRPKLSNRVSAN